MNILIKIITITMILISEPQAMEVKDTNEENLEMMLFNHYLPGEIQTLILRSAVLECCYTLGHAGALGAVCKDWYNFIKANQRSNLSFYPIPHNMEESCLFEILQNGKLIYKRNDGRVVELPFAFLGNARHYAERFPDWQAQAPVGIF